VKDFQRKIVIEERLSGTWLQLVYYFWFLSSGEDLAAVAAQTANGRSSPIALGSQQSEPYLVA
jgi:hypothetical protein